MIDENDIGRAIGLRVKGITDIPAQLLAGNYDKPESWARPYLVFQVVPNGTGGSKISGGLTQAGFVQVTVVTDLAIGETLANDVTAKIAAAFPYELTIPCGDGKLTITDHTVPDLGYRDGSDWRKPVKIDYIAI